MSDVIGSQVIDDVCIVTITQRVILSERECDAITLCFLSLDYGPYHIVIDFDVVELYASLALSPLLAAYEALKETGKGLAMINVRDSVYAMFVNTKMSRDFHRYENLELAKQALRRAA